MVGRWSSVAQCGCPSHHAQQLCLTLVLCASMSVTTSLDSAETLQTAKRPRSSSLLTEFISSCEVPGLQGVTGFEMWAISSWMPLIY